MSTGSNPFSGYAAAFDALLESNRRQLEQRFDRPGRAAVPERSDLAQEVARPLAAAPAAAAPVGASKVPESTAAATPGSTADGAEERFLNDRFGQGGWDYEIVSREQLGDEMVVLCKLTLQEQGVTRSQFGRARLRGNAQGRGTGPGVRGTVGGTPFTLRPAQPDSDALVDAATGDSTADPAEDAFRRALDDALRKCAEML